MRRAKLKGALQTGNWFVSVFPPPGCLWKNVYTELVQSGPFQWTLEVEGSCPAMAHDTGTQTNAHAAVFLLNTLKSGLDLGQHQVTLDTDPEITLCGGQ